MNPTKPKRRTLTHHIRIPIATDVPALMGNYHNLFIAQGMQSDIPYRSDGHFSHPIPESQQQLLNDFMNMNQKLLGLKMSYEQFRVENVMINPSGLMATFTITMQDKQDYVLFPQL